MLLLVGAGCVAKSSQSPQIPVQQNSTSSSVSTSTTTNNLPQNVVLADKQEEYKNWKTISIGGIITLQIPSNCSGNGAAGSTYIICPTPDNETPTPEMSVSSDGIQVNIRRWEGLESKYWDSIVSSLKVITPLMNAIQINIDK